MDIKPNTFTPNTTAYFARFTPYRLPDGTTTVNSIENMVSYDVVPNSNGTLIDWIYGTLEVFSFEVNVKNLTENATLDVNVQHDRYFTVDNDSFSIRPGETNSFTASTNNVEVNVSSSPFQIPTSVIMNITNRQTDSVVIISLDETELDQSSLGDLVTLA